MKPKVSTGRSEACFLSRHKWGAFCFEDLSRRVHRCLSFTQHIAERSISLCQGILISHEVLAGGQVLGAGELQCPRVSAPRKVLEGQLMMLR